MVCFKFSHVFLFMQSFFYSWQLHRYIAKKDEKSNPPVCKIASKSFNVKKLTVSDETYWLKKLNVWSSSIDLQNRTAFSTR